MAEEHVKMDKIKELLAKAGCKPELVSAIHEQLIKYKNKLDEDAKCNLAARINEAKKLCAEEVENYKKDLARRLQIFCEAKSRAIESHVAKQATLRESQAVSKINDIKKLIGVLQTDSADLRSHAASKATLAKLTEERNRAIAEANQKTALAESVLKTNRQLTIENHRLKNKVSTVAQNTAIKPSRPTKPAQRTIQESVISKAPLANTPKKPETIIDQIAATLND